MLHRAESTGALAVQLAAVLAAGVEDPFAPEVVAVPAKGVERWLTQQLSGVLGAGPSGDGVAAGIAFTSPTRLVDDVLAAVLGLPAEDDPWMPERTLWLLLELLDRCAGEAWCAVVSAHLGRGPDSAPGEVGRRRYATAAALSRLFRSYAAARPQMLLDWSAGKDTDGRAPLAPDLRWQAELWRRLRAGIGEPSPAERLGPACRALVDEPQRSDLPARLSLFGATRLTAEQRAVVRALAVGRDVHAWLPHPSPVMWDRLAGRPAPPTRRADTSALQVRHPLLASLARDVRELQAVLEDPAGPADPADHEDPADPADPAAPAAPAAPGPLELVTRHHGEAARPRTLLQHLQAAVREDRLPASGARADGTVQVHACHGPGRQVEVLREALLHRFAADPTLEPRDVLVLCPDVDDYAPLVAAAFGQPGGAHPGHSLRVRVADRALTQTNPLLAVLATLLQLAGGRVTASELLDLAASAPVRRAFGLHDDELERLRGWAERTGVRWGLGTAQRAAFSLQDVEQNTWRTGLDRLLLGVATDETEPAWLGTALPLDDVDSSDVDLAGRLAELVDRLEAVLDSLVGPQPVGRWVAALAGALDLLTEVRDADAWQAVQARGELAAAAEHAGGDGPVLTLADVRVLLADRLAGRPTRANFRTGELTVATMVPMRSVPHRVVALLGLDDGAFPRATGVDGDDVLARDPRPGERDAASEDRQLLLDALMSAQDCLLLLHTGADPVSGLPRPPAVPLGEVLDVLRTTTGDDRLEGVLRRHPLQPFDARNFDAAEPFSFDPQALAGARAAARPRQEPPRLVPVPLPARPAGTVELSELVSVLVHPVRGFLRRRLGISLVDLERTPVDAVATSLDALATWEVGERLLAARLRGVSAAAFRQAEWRRGTLPPGPLGFAVMVELEQAVEPIVAASSAVRLGRRQVLDVRVVLPDGRRVTGAVADVFCAGSVLSVTGYSRLAPKHRLGAWIQLVALAAAGGPGAAGGGLRAAGGWGAVAGGPGGAGGGLRAAAGGGAVAGGPGRVLAPGAATADPAAGPGATAIVLGRGKHRHPVQRSTLTAPDDPLAELASLVELYDEALREPLPVAPGACAAYAERRERTDPHLALEAAAKAFDDRFGDVADTALEYVHGVDGDPPRFEQLLEQRGAVEPTRFGDLACRLWLPLLQHESLDTPGRSP